MLVSFNLYDVLYKNIEYKLDYYVLHIIIILILSVVS
jgi:hypothetical protein